MIHEILPVGPLQCNCSILGDETSHEAIVVDPGDDIPRIMAVLATHNLTVKKIIITHAHIDHIAGAHRLKQLTGAPILYNQNDLPLVKMMDIQAGWLGIPTPTVSSPDDTLEDGKLISVTGITGSIIHTPGHTEGSVCLFLVGVVLLQQGKSADLAGAFGGQGSQTAFGPRGAANLLTKLTTYSAVIFMITSIGLTIMLSRGSSDHSVLSGT